MSRRQASTEIDLQTLFEGAKEVPRVSNTVRARVLARARATAASPVLPLESLRPRLHFPRYAVAPAAGAVVIVGGVVAALVSLHGRAPGPVAPRAVAPTVVSRRVEPPAARDLPGAAVAPSRGAAPVAESSGAQASKLAPGSRRPGTEEAYDAELELMRSAHNAYAAHDYANALVSIGEHAHRFPGGLLAEEREALRVRCLVGAGRTSQARRAVAAFEKRFPRSVLLQRLQAEVGKGDD